MLISSSANLLIGVNPYMSISGKFLIIELRNLKYLVRHTRHDLE